MQGTPDPKATPVEQPEAAPVLPRTLVDENDDRAPPAVVPVEYVCDVDSDCVIQEMACCDACNGGVTFSVRSEVAAEFRKRHGEECAGKELDCTEMGCHPEVAVCHEGECKSLSPDSVDDEEPYTRVHKNPPLPLVGFW